ncbi:MAG: hypothetical protein FWD23_18200, partial [Oscillospiraceae bacterium]|nr:hypothetical protein [Oscillospiraceae bacterium]
FIGLFEFVNRTESEISVLLEPHMDRIPYDMASFREKLDICLKSGTSHWYIIGQKDKGVRDTEDLIREFWGNGIMHRYENCKKSLFWSKFWCNILGYIALAVAVISGIAFILGKQTYNDMTKTVKQLKKKTKEI